MKKLLVVAIAAAFAAPIFAQEEGEEAASAAGVALEVETDAVPAEAAWWPACLALCEWPETPDMIGLRFTIPFSTKQENVTGIDLGFWGRCKDFEGIQLSVLRNDVKDTFGGIQVGLYNTIGRGDLCCVQVGLWNESYSSFRGIQAGLVNVTGDAEGFQVGLFNRAESLYGFQVGLINVIRDAEIPVLPLINIGF